MTTTSTYGIHKKSKTTEKLWTKWIIVFPFCFLAAQLTVLPVLMPFEVWMNFRNPKFNQKRLFYFSKSAFPWHISMGTVLSSSIRLDNSPQRGAAALTSIIFYLAKTCNVLIPSVLPFYRLCVTALSFLSCSSIQRSCLFMSVCSGHCSLLPVFPSDEITWLTWCSLPLIPSQSVSKSNINPSACALDTSLCATCTSFTALCSLPGFILIMFWTLLLVSFPKLACFCFFLVLFLFCLLGYFFPL